MSHDECIRALGVAPNATWEEVRRAYKDLVRVWHPDRFESDPQLRERAEQHLQKINEAYFALKNADIFVGCRPEPPSPPRPADPGPAATVPPQPRRRLQHFLWDLETRVPAKALTLGVVCFTPLIFASLVLNALRVPTLDSVLPQSGLPRPALLTPSRIINPFSDKSLAAEALSAWARGEGVDLWRSIPNFGQNVVEPAAHATNSAGPQREEAPHTRQRFPDVTTITPATPVNGTELLWTSRSGAGELWVSNETGHDAFATLVQAHTTAPLRAIYIQARNKVCMRNIPPGLYDLVAEVGENWDPHRIRFRAARHPLERSGPFDFFDVTSAQGSSGRRFDVVLRTQ